MFEIIETKEHAGLTLDDYAADAKFAAMVGNLRSEAIQLKSRLDGRTIWMVNSTAVGGGVAEMLPRMISLMTELGLTVRWGVIGTDRHAFFELTKRLHNLIHGDARAGLEFSGEDALLYERVNRDNVQGFKPHLRTGDIVVVHDPQPLPLGQMLTKEAGVTCVWRCHIGLDKRTDATRAAWRFLRPYLDRYAHAIFSVPEYIPSFLAGHASIIYPGIDPLSHKNRDLPVHKIVGILCNSGLQAPHEPVATPEFAHRVRRIMPDGSTQIPGEIGLLFRPTVVQISRWDRLKGWAPLLEGFIRMKQRCWNGQLDHLDRNLANRVSLCRLVLAGPDPAFIADDPEGIEAFEEVCGRFAELDARTQADVAVLQLPMVSRKENALIVNALQRCASIVAQNSIREGFGLTLTEAMWKHVAVLGTHACGLRLQVRDGIDGRLSRDAANPDEIADNLCTMMLHPLGRQLMGRSAQRRVYDEFLVFRQISRYIELFSRLVAS